MNSMGYGRPGTADGPMQVMAGDSADYGTTTAKIARILTIMYDRGWSMWGRDAEIERLLNELRED